MDSLTNLQLQLKSILGRYGYLSLLLVSIGVMLLSTVLFESLSVESVEDLKRNLAGQIQFTASSTEYATGLLPEFPARYFWLASALLNIGTTIYVSVIGILIIAQCHSGQRLQFIWLLTIGLCCLNLLSLHYSVQNEGALYRLIYGTTAWCLNNSDRFGDEFLLTVENIIATVNICASIAPIIIAMAIASTVSPSATDDRNLHELTQLPARMRLLKSSLKLATALLVIGILHMNAWLQWPSTFIRDETLRKLYSEAGLAVAIYWGTTFSLMLFLTYGPASSYLSAQARKLISSGSNQAKDLQDHNKWLKDNELSASFGDQMPQLLMMLAPIVAGPLEFSLMHGA